MLNKLNSKFKIQHSTLERSDRGITLIELMIAMAISAVVAGTIVAILATGLRFWRRGADKSRILQSLQAVTSRMEKEIEETSKIYQAEGTKYWFWREGYSLQPSPSPPEGDEHRSNEIVVFEYTHELRGSDYVGVVYRTVYDGYTPTMVLSPRTLISEPSVNVSNLRFTYFNYAGYFSQEEGPFSPIKAGVKPEPYTRAIPSRIAPDYPQNVWTSIRWEADVDASRTVKAQTRYILNTAGTPYDVWWDDALPAGPPAAVAGTTASWTSVDAGGSKAGFQPWSGAAALKPTSSQVYGAGTKRIYRYGFTGAAALGGGAIPSYDQIYFNTIGAANPITVFTNQPTADPDTSVNGTQIEVTLAATGGVLSASGKVTLEGTDPAGSPIQETLDMFAGGFPMTTNLIFKTITKITTTGVPNNWWITVVNPNKKNWAFVMVNLDTNPIFPPKEVMIGLHCSGCVASDDWRYAYWSAYEDRDDDYELDNGIADTDLNGDGVTTSDGLIPRGFDGEGLIDGHNRIWMGPLPSVGGWVALGIPLSNPGIRLDGGTIDGMGMLFYDGRIDATYPSDAFTTFDKAAYGRWTGWFGTTGLGAANFYTIKAGENLKGPGRAGGTNQTWNSADPLTAQFIQYKKSLETGIPSDTPRLDETGIGHGGGGSVWRTNTSDNWRKGLFNNTIVSGNSVKLWRYSGDENLAQGEEGPITVTGLSGISYKSTIWTKIRYHRGSEVWPFAGWNKRRKITLQDQDGLIHSGEPVVVDVVTAVAGVDNAIRVTTANGLEKPYTVLQDAGATHRIVFLGSCLANLTSTYYVYYDNAGAPAPSYSHLSDSAIIPAWPKGAGIMGNYFSLSSGTYGSRWWPTAGAPGTAYRGVRVDNTVSFNWAGGSPGFGIGTNYFSVGWRGFVNVNVSGAWTFRMDHDDNARLAVNGNTVSDDVLGTHNPGDNLGPIALSPGIYRIEMDMAEYSGNAYAELRGTGPVGSWGAAGNVVIPKDRLYPYYGGGEFPRGNATANPPTGLDSLWYSPYGWTTSRRYLKATLGPEQTATTPDYKGTIDLQTRGSGSDTVAADGQQNDTNPDANWTAWSAFLNPGQAYPLNNGATTSDLDIASGVFRYLQFLATLTVEPGDPLGSPLLDKVEVYNQQLDDDANPSTGLAGWVQQNLQDDYEAGTPGTSTTPPDTGQPNVNVRKYPGQVTLASSLGNEAQTVEKTAAANFKVNTACDNPDTVPVEVCWDKVKWNVGMQDWYGGSRRYGTKIYVCDYAAPCPQASPVNPYNRTRMGEPVTVNAILTAPGISYYGGKDLKLTTPTGASIAYIITACVGAPNCTSVSIQFQSSVTAGSSSTYYLFWGWNDAQFAPAPVSYPYTDYGKNTTAAMQFSPGSGVYSRYFDNPPLQAMRFTNFRGERIDPQVYNNYDASPPYGMTDYFSVRLSGWIYTNSTPVSGQAFSFSINHDDWNYFMIDWNDAGDYNNTAETTGSATVHRHTGCCAWEVMGPTLARGFHPIYLEMMEYSGGASLYLQGLNDIGDSSPGTAIAQTNFYPRYVYRDGVTGSGTINQSLSTCANTGACGVYGAKVWDSQDPTNQIAVPYGTIAFSTRGAHHDHAQCSGGHAGFDFTDDGDATCLFSAAGVLDTADFAEGLFSATGADIDPSPLKGEATIAAASQNFRFLQLRPKLDAPVTPTASPVLEETYVHRVPDDKWVQIGGAKGSPWGSGIVTLYDAFTAGTNWSSSGDATFNITAPVAMPDGTTPTTVRMGGPAWSNITRTVTSNVGQVLTADVLITIASATPHVLAFDDGLALLNRFAVQYTGTQFRIQYQKGGAGWVYPFTFPMSAPINSWYTVELQYEPSGRVHAWVHGKDQPRDSLNYYTTTGFPVNWTRSVKSWSDVDYFYLANYYEFTTVSENIDFTSRNPDIMLQQDISSAGFTSTNQALQTSNFYFPNGCIPGVNCSTIIELDTPGDYNVLNDNTVHDTAGGGNIVDTSIDLNSNGGLGIHRHKPLATLVPVTCNGWINTKGMQAVPGDSNWSNSCSQTPAAVQSWPDDWIFRRRYDFMNVDAQGRTSFHEPEEFLAETVSTANPDNSIRLEYGDLNTVAVQDRHELIGGGKGIAYMYYKKEGSFSWACSTDWASDTGVAGDCDSVPAGTSQVAGDWNPAGNTTYNVTQSANNPLTAVRIPGGGYSYIRRNKGTQIAVRIDSGASMTRDVSNSAVQTAVLNYYFDGNSASRDILLMTGLYTGSDVGWAGLYECGINLNTTSFRVKHTIKGVVTYPSGLGSASVGRWYQLSVGYGSGGSCQYQVRDILSGATNTYTSVGALFPNPPDWGKTVVLYGGSVNSSWGANYAECNGFQDMGCNVLGAGYRAPDVTENFSSAICNNTIFTCAGSVATNQTLSAIVTNPSRIIRTAFYTAATSGTPHVLAFDGQNFRWAVHYHPAVACGAKAAPCFDIQKNVAGAWSEVTGSGLTTNNSPSTGQWYNVEIRYYTADPANVQVSAAVWPYGSEDPPSNVIYSETGSGYPENWQWDIYSWSDVDWTVLGDYREANDAGTIIINDNFLTAGNWTYSDAAGGDDFDAPPAAPVPYSDPDANWAVITDWNTTKTVRIGGPAWASNQSNFYGDPTTDPDGGGPAPAMNTGNPSQTTLDQEMRVDVFVPPDIDGGAAGCPHVFAWEGAGGWRFAVQWDCGTADRFNIQRGLAGVYDTPFTFPLVADAGTAGKWYTVEMQYNTNPDATANNSCATAWVYPKGQAKDTANQYQSCTYQDYWQRYVISWSDVNYFYLTNFFESHYSGYEPIHRLMTLAKASAQDFAGPTGSGSGPYWTYYGNSSAAGPAFTIGDWQAAPFGAGGGSAAHDYHCTGSFFGLIPCGWAGLPPAQDLTYSVTVSPNGPDSANAHAHAPSPTWEIHAANHDCISGGAANNFATLWSGWFWSRGDIDGAGVTDPDATYRASHDYMGYYLFDDEAAARHAHMAVGTNESLGILPNRSGAYTPDNMHRYFLGHLAGGLFSNPEHFGFYYYWNDTTCCNDAINTADTYGKLYQSDRELDTFLAETSINFASTPPYNPFKVVKGIEQGKKEWLVRPTDFGDLGSFVNLEFTGVNLDPDDWLIVVDNKTGDRVWARRGGGAWSGWTGWLPPGTSTNRIVNTDKDWRNELKVIYSWRTAGAGGRGATLNSYAYVPAISGGQDCATGGGEPHEAIDGILAPGGGGCANNFWNSRYDQPARNWMTVDLGVNPEGSDGLDNDNLNGIDDASEKLWSVGSWNAIFYYGDGRYYRFKVEGSSDLTSWEALCGTYGGPDCANWLGNSTASAAAGYSDFFSPKRVRYIKITVTFNSVNAGAHIVEFRAYQPKFLTPGYTIKQIPLEPFEMVEDIQYLRVPAGDVNLHFRKLRLGYYGGGACGWDTINIYDDSTGQFLRSYSCTSWANMATDGVPAEGADDDGPSDGTDCATGVGADAGCWTGYLNSNDLRIVLRYNYQAQGANDGYLIDSYAYRPQAIACMNNKPATVASCTNPYGCRTIDGDLGDGNFWDPEAPPGTFPHASNDQAPDGSTGGHWMLINMGRITSINKVAVVGRWSTNYAYKYKVKLSFDGENFLLPGDANRDGDCTDGGETCATPYSADMTLNAVGSNTVQSTGYEHKFVRTDAQYVLVVFNPGTDSRLVEVKIWETPFLSPGTLRSEILAPRRDPADDTIIMGSWNSASNVTSDWSMNNFGWAGGWRAEGSQASPTVNYYYVDPAGVDVPIFSGANPNPPFNPAYELWPGAWDGVTHLKFNSGNQFIHGPTLDTVFDGTNDAFDAGIPGHRDPTVNPASDYEVARYLQAVFSTSQGLGPVQWAFQSYLGRDDFGANYTGYGCTDFPTKGVAGSCTGWQWRYTGTRTGPAADVYGTTIFDMNDATNAGAPPSNSLGSGHSSTWPWLYLMSDPVDGTVGVNAQGILTLDGVTALATMDLTDRNTVDAGIQAYQPPRDFNLTNGDSTPPLQVIVTGGSFTNGGSPVTGIIRLYGRDQNNVSFFEDLRFNENGVQNTRRKFAAVQADDGIITTNMADQDVVPKIVIRTQSWSGTVRRLAFLPSTTMGAGTKVNIDSLRVLPKTSYQKVDTIDFDTYAGAGNAAYLNLHFTKYNLYGDDMVRFVDRDSGQTIAVFDKTMFPGGCTAATGCWTHNLGFGTGESSLRIEFLYNPSGDVTNLNPAWTVDKYRRGHRIYYSSYYTTADANRDACSGSSGLNTGLKNCSGWRAIDGDGTAYWKSKNISVNPDAATMRPNPWTPGVNNPMGWYIELCPTDIGCTAFAVNKFVTKWKNNQNCEVRPKYSADAASWSTAAVLVSGGDTMITEPIDISPLANRYVGVFLDPTTCPVTTVPAELYEFEIYPAGDYADRGLYFSPGYIAPSHSAWTIPYPKDAYDVRVHFEKFKAQIGPEAFENPPYEDVLRFFKADDAPGLCAFTVFDLEGAGAANAELNPDGLGGFWTDWLIAQNNGPAPATYNPDCLGIRFKLLWTAPLGYWNEGSVSTVDDDTWVIDRYEVYSAINPTLIKIDIAATKGKGRSAVVVSHSTQVQPPNLILAK